MSSATTVWLPVPAMPLACQSSSRDSSLALTMTQSGIASSPDPTTRVDDRPVRALAAGVEPPSARHPVAAVNGRGRAGGREHAADARDRASREISSCASSGNVPASHDIALKMVATHEEDGQPRATCASTSHCVWKSTSSPPYLRGAVMRNTPASASASKCSGRTRLACSVATAFSARRGHQRERAGDDGMWLGHGTSLGERAGLQRLVHRFEGGRRHGVGVGALGVVRHEVGAGGVVGHAFLGRRPSRPLRCAPPTPATPCDTARATARDRCGRRSRDRRCRPRRCSARSNRPACRSATSPHLR